MLLFYFSRFYTDFRPFFLLCQLSGMFPQVIRKTVLYLFSLFFLPIIKKDLVLIILGFKGTVSRYIVFYGWIFNQYCQNLSIDVANNTRFLRLKAARCRGFWNNTILLWGNSFKEGLKMDTAWCKHLKRTLHIRRVKNKLNLKRSFKVCRKLAYYLLINHHLMHS